MGGQRTAADDPTDHQRIRVLEAGHCQLVEQLSEMVVAMRGVDSRMGGIEGATLEVRDILTAAKGAFKVLGWLGAAAKWAAAVCGALTAIYVGAYTMTHGKPPWP